MFVDVYFEIYTFWIFLKLSAVEANYDPWKTDFCNLTCKLNGTTYENSACDCYLSKGYEEITENVLDFRQKVVDEHNRLRNYIASGQEKNEKAGEAANMLAVSYNLALEHVARCFAGKFVLLQQKCRAIPGFPNVGQNIGGHTFRKIGQAIDHIQAWYDEVKYINASFIEHFYVQTNPPNAHFSQLSWATHRFVGCARVWNPKNPKEAWRFVIICNYAGDSAPNSPGQPVYKKGPKCSACPNATSCNKQYPGLCGEVAPIPKDRMVLIPGKNSTFSATEISTNKIILPVAFIVSWLL